MDIQLEKKKGLQKKHIPYVAGGAFFLVLVGWIVFGDHASTLKVDARGVNIGNVTKEQFNDFVRVNGQVQPITVVQLSPEEGGIVQEKVVEEGAQVKKGDVIIRLSNSNLDLQILDAEAQLAEKQNFLRNTQVTMEQDKLNNQLEKAQLDVDMTRYRRAYNQQKKLYEENLIAKEEFLKAKEDFELASKKYDLVVERLRQDSISRTIQMDEMETSLSNMRKNIALVHERKEHLNVRSQIDGELGLLDVVLGQNVSAGQKIGQINDLSDYKIEALIDEHYIDRVKPGLEGSFERQGKKFSMVVKTVFPEVRDGQFRTWCYLTGERPDNMRSGQTYNLNLELGQPTDAIIIPRGAFYQTTGGSWIFVVSPDGTKAYRRPVKLGRQNPRYYEVLDGLDDGEKVIVSSYETYGDNEVLLLK